MQHGIVEGEPGIFPDPISRLMRKIGGLFDRKPKPGDPAAADRPSAPTPEDQSTPSSEGGAPSRAEDDQPGSSPDDQPRQ